MAGFLPTVTAAAARTAWIVVGSGVQLQITIASFRVSLMRQVPFSQPSSLLWFPDGEPISQSVDSLTGRGRPSMRSSVPALGRIESAGDAGAPDAVRENTARQPKHTATTRRRNGMVFFFRIFCQSLLVSR